MKYRKPNLFCYRLAQIVSWFVATFVFRRKILRSEIRKKKGPFVVIANHQTALDFVNLIGVVARPMTFVISNSFYRSLPIKGFLDKMGVIPKQQFQTTPQDLKRMKSVIDHGAPLVIYPAGLMCEDGLSTPIPQATYKFLRWLGVDVYVARCSGTYFVMPKWAKGMRPGRTYMDVHQLFSAEELKGMELDEIKRKTDEALLFDAYREQDARRVRYRGGDQVEGLQHVLYICPHCGKEFSVEVADGNTLRCKECGFSQISDAYGLLHRSGTGEEVRYVSDWSNMIHDRIKARMEQGQDCVLSADTKIHMIDEKKHKFTEAGSGIVTLTQDGFLLRGELHGEAFSVSIPIAGVPALPFSPGRHLEIQHGSVIYRCVPEDGHLVMKFIHMVKIFHELEKVPV